ncbi:flagellar assembly protein T N-terminal domain-containing protein [Pseudoalteromonas sp. S16_S37]|uniref:flagellar assembly protein T N-terminal domain-containing protein n=1 Tax=Pseudoalteromonas sp. S16_S37 TaxID=2720228 RepID=UPI0016805B39|nr:flagellar assembly protein T N-terminal domain-containing protein [Pseudoalteromonas sp. S16_S37]MBD1582976.1 flagellar biosynthesis protein FlgT [Pseudoalteromonas sp. S16_S37]
MIKAITLLILICVSTVVKAEWYEVVGYASTQGRDVAQARQAAVKDAITQALIFSGATVSSVQSVADGILSQDEIKIKSHGEIQQVNMVSESKEGDQYSVTLHLDIYATKGQCLEQQFNKQIAITQSQLIQPHQARLGQIFDIAKAASQRLFNTLNERTNAVKPIPYLNSAINVKEYFSQQFDYNHALIETIAMNSNSQYVLLSQITDIADIDKLNNDYAFWQSDEYARSFKIDFALYDAMTYEKVWQQHYATQGVWPFEKTKLVDVYSDRFWNSHYGQEIQEVFNKVSQDLNTAVSCIPTKGKILYLDAEQIVINLGRVHGLEPGTTLSIMHQSNIITSRGSVVNSTVQTIEQVKVINVNMQSATAVNLNTRPLSNIQLNDIVQIKIKNENNFALDE